MRTVSGADPVEVTAMNSDKARTRLLVLLLGIALAAAAAGLSPGPAGAACPQGKCDTGCTTSYYWAAADHWYESTMPIPYYINLNGASDCTGDEFQAVVRAMHNWEDLHQTFWSTCYKGTTNKHANNKDGYNVISWENLGGSAPLTIATAYYWYDDPRDSVYEADVALNDNAAVHWSAFKADSCADNCHDVENCAAHEFGHWLILGHSCDTVATMYCYVDTLETMRRSPAECDVKGMQYKYSHASGDAHIMPGCWPKSLDHDILTNPVLGDVNRDGKEEVVFATEDGNVHVLLGSSDEAGAWPQSVGSRTESSPALGDVDADNWLEIVIGSESDSVYVLNYDGSRQANWPKGTKNDVRSSPALGDVDADGDVDVVCASTDSCVYAWDGSTGNSIEGWPVKLGNSIPLAGPALADLNGDDSLEVIITGYDNYVYALKPHGANLSGWPQFTGRKVYERVAVGDIDNDTQFEVVAVAPCDTVYAWNANGSRCAGWPVYHACLLGNSAPALGNLDADAALEVVFGSDFDSVYAYNGDGSRLSGWPKYAGGNVKGSPVIVDLDADNLYEVVVANSAGKVYAFNGNGTPVSANWPKTLPQQNYLRSPAIGDINNDSELDLVVGSGSPAYLFAYSLGTVMDADAYQWRMYGHDWNRTSRYGFAPSAPSVLFFGDLILDLSNWNRWGFGSSFIDLSTIFNSPPYSMGVSGSPLSGSGAMAQSVSITPDFTQPYELRFAFMYDSFMMNNWIVFGHIRIRFTDMFSPLYFDIAGDWSTLIPSGAPFDSYCFSGAFTQFRITVDPPTRTIVVYADDYPVASVEYLASLVPGDRILIEDSMYEDEYLYGFFDDFEVLGSLPPAAGVEDPTPEAPLINVLYQSYPNPMNPLATIKYSVKETGRVTLTIYDVSGRTVRVLVDEAKQASPTPYSVVWDGKNDAGKRVASGVYFCEMRAKKFSSAKKIVVLR
jgi:hypothetical protein